MYTFSEFQGLFFFWHFNSSSFQRQFQFKSSYDKMGENAPISRVRVKDFVSLPLTPSTAFLLTPIQGVGRCGLNCRPASFLHKWFHEISLRSHLDCDLRYSQVCFSYFKEDSIFCLLFFISVLYNSVKFGPSAS